MIAAIPPDQIERMWHIIGPGIERCLDKGIGLQSAAGIKRSAIAGDVIVLSADVKGIHLATVIAQVNEGSRRVFEVGLAWGEKLVDWNEEIEGTILRLARELNCDSVAITGRRGWVRYLKKRGFTEKMVTVTRNL